MTGAGIAEKRDDAVDPDLEVLRRVAAGEADAFEALVERNQRRLLAVCERFLGDSEAARDATQEVFLKAWRKAGGFRPRGRVSTWLYRIAVNHCLNRLRRRKIARMLPFGGDADETTGAPAVVWEPPAQDPDPQRTLEARERWQRTRRAIDALPHGQRAVLILARFEGLSYREIAEVLGVTLGAVESRLFRAMRNLERAADPPREAGRERTDDVT